MNVNVKLYTSRDKPKDKNFIFWGEDGLMFDCDRFISSPTGRWGMAMARKAWLDAV